MATFASGPPPVRLQDREPLRSYSSSGTRPRPAGHCRLSRIAIVSRRENGARCSSMAGGFDAVDKTLGSSTKAGTRRLIRVRQRGRRAPRPVKAPASGGRRYGVPAERAPRRALPGTDRPSRTGRGRPARRCGIPPRAPTTPSLPGRARSGGAEVRVPELARARHADRARAGEPVQRPLGVRVDTGNALPAGDARALVPAGGVRGLTAAPGPARMAEVRGLGADRGAAR
jgi:hypothetical protein